MNVSIRSLHRFESRPAFGFGARIAAALCVSLSCSLNAQQPAPVAPAGPQAVQPAPLSPRGDEVVLNFRDADIESVANAFGHLLGRNLIVDPRVRGKMTLETARPVGRQQAFELFRISLRGLGFAFVETGGVGRIVPEADAKLVASPVTVPDGAPASSGEQIVTQVFRLKHETAANLVPVLRPLIAPNNTVVAYPGNNSLVVTDYASNVARIAKIIESIDTAVANEVEVVPMVHALALDVAVAVNRMLDESARAGAQQQQTDPTQRVTVFADARLNSVLIRTSSPERMKLARSLIARLDVASSEPGNIHVVYLRNAEAVKLAQTLRGVLAGEGGGPGGGAGPTTFGQSLSASGQTSSLGGTALSAGPQPGGGPAGTAGSLSAGAMQSGSASQQLGASSVRAGGAIITADPASNALIITAPDAVYRSVRAVIDKLDARRAQVFIESLIVEVQADKAAELGIQWQFLGAPEGSTRGFGGTNFGSGGSNIVSLAVTPTQAPSAGLNIGLVRGTAQIGNTQVLNLGLLARALETDASANILATPNLLTLDNEEARIIIGQNVPFITGQFTSLANAGNAAANPFQTIERRDVGTTLRVRPQISESGTVRLQIFQEVSSVKESTTSGIITNRRAIESTVLVDDGEIIVLGGLIEETISGTEQKVPGLGDLPLVGGLFRFEGRKRVKNNLLVFLRPFVLRDMEAANAVSASRYDYIRALRNDARIPARGVLPEVGGMPIPVRPDTPSTQPRQPAAVRQPGFSLSPQIRPDARPEPPFSADPPRVDTP
jgi:general secretion pathway protein D